MVAGRVGQADCDLIRVGAWRAGARQPAQAASVERLGAGRLSRPYEPSRCPAYGWDSAATATRNARSVAVALSQPGPVRLLPELQRPKTQPVALP